MQRSKKIIFISHCVLNQNTVVCPLARAKGAYSEVIKTIMENDIGIHQLPCPEFKYLGLTRKPMDKEQYDTEEYRIICKMIAKELIKTIKEYKRDNYDIVGLVGINESPTCSIGNNQGILMEEIMLLLDKENIVLNTIDISTDYDNEKDNTKFIDDFKIFLNN